MSESRLSERIPSQHNFRLFKFFRLRLLTLDSDAVQKLIDGYERDVRAYKDDALRLCWYMRGGLSYDDAMLLSSTDRELIGKLVKDNLETTKKSNMPFF